MKIPLILIITALAPVASQADMTIVQKLKSDLMSGEGRDSTMTMIVKGRKARIDLPAGKMSSIIDMDGGKMYTLNHAQKQVIIIPIDEIKAAAESARRNASGAAKSAVAKTGRTDNIQGHKCAEYEITGGGSNPTIIRCWIASDIDDSELEVFRSFGRRMGCFLGMDGVEKPKGMVMRSQTDMQVGGRKVVSMSQVESIKREPVADSLFAVPADYAAMDMPRLGGRAEDK